MTAARAIARRAAPAAALLSLLGCAVAPGTPPATPPVAAAAPPASPTLPDFSGTYTGIAHPIVSGGGTCIRPVNVTDFQVEGRSVQWGRFRGRIDANAGLQMVFGQLWVIGRFTDGAFTGRFISSGRPNATSRLAPRSRANDCMFALDLRRTGA